MLATCHRTPQAQIHLPTNHPAHTANYIVENAVDGLLKILARNELAPFLVDDHPTKGAFENSTEKLRELSLKKYVQALVTSK